MMPLTHPLAGRASVYLHQLAGENIFVPHAHEMFGPYAQNYLLASKAAKNRIYSTHTHNLMTALFGVSLGQGLCIAPQYARHLFAPNLTSVNVANSKCRFDEYAYYTETGNSAAELFFRKLSHSVT